MTSVARIVEYVGKRPGRQVWTWCPGCDSLHPFTIEAPPGEDGDQLNSGITWQWDGDLERPTFSPSLLCYSSVHICEGEHEPTVCEAYPDCRVQGHSIGAWVDGVLLWKFPGGFPDEAERVYAHQAPHTREPAWGNCHSFLRNGRWEFLGDSAHHLAGQTVDMVPLPGRYVGDSET